MPRVALHLVVLACVLLSGCAGITPPTTGSEVGTETPEPTTESPANDCPPIEDYQQRSFPEKPENLTTDTVAEFAVAYEETYVWNEYAPHAESSLHVGTRAKITERVGNGYIVHVDGGFSHASCSAYSRTIADGSLHTNYFVNDTLAVRRSQPDHWTSNPWRNNGTVLERWND